MKELLFGICAGENWVPCLWFDMPDNRKNSLWINFWTCAFQTLLLSYWHIWAKWHRTQFIAVQVLTLQTHVSMQGEPAQGVIKVFLDVCCSPTGTGWQSLSREVMWKHKCILLSPNKMKFPSSYSFRSTSKCVRSCSSHMNTNGSQKGRRHQQPWQLRFKYCTSANSTDTNDGALPELGRAVQGRPLESLASQSIHLWLYWAANLADDPTHLQTLLERA